MATFAKFLKLDSMSQVSGPKKSKTVAPRIDTVLKISRSSNVSESLIRPPGQRPVNHPWIRSEQWKGWGLVWIATFDS